jgi:uncharacterized membrane protein
MNMKEIKNFFGNDNKLNKGYTKLQNNSENDSSFYQKKFSHILPPIDLISEFENIHPGTLARLIDMAEKEQNHRHALELVGLDSQSRAMKMGRICALIFVGIICVATITLAILSYLIGALIFAGIAFASIALVSYRPNKRPFRKVEPAAEPEARRNNPNNMRRKIRR